MGKRCVVAVVVKNLFNHNVSLMLMHKHHGCNCGNEDVPLRMVCFARKPYVLGAAFLRTRVVLGAAEGVVAAGATARAGVAVLASLRLAMRACNLLCARRRKILRVLRLSPRPMCCLLRFDVKKRTLCSKCGRLSTPCLRNGSSKSVRVNGCSVAAWGALRQSACLFQCSFRRARARLRNKSHFGQVEPTPKTNKNCIRKHAKTFCKRKSILCAHKAVFGV